MNKLSFKPGLGIVLTMLIISCNGPRESASVDSTANVTADSITLNIAEDKILSIGDVLSKLPELSEPIDYSETYFDNYDSLQRLFQKSPSKLCEQMSSTFISDAVWCDDNAYFVWKVSYESFTLVDFVTTSFNPKGQCVYHHLVTVDKEGRVIELYPEWAAIYAVGVENPNGGTSAGVEYKVGSIALDPIARILSTDAEGKSITREVSNEGHFVEGILFEAERDLSGEEEDSENN